MESINILGILFMALSWGAIITLNVFCFRKVFAEKEQNLIGPLEVEAEIDELAK